MTVSQFKKLIFGQLVRKIDLKFVFCFTSPVIFVHKGHITHLWCIKNQNRKIYGFVLSLDTFSILKTFFNFFNFWHI